MKKIVKTILILLIFIGTNSFANESVNVPKVILDDVEIIGTNINEDDQKD